jgi:5-methylcytosine-specific restriction enzyme A
MNPIERARSFVRTKVINPALSSEGLSKKSVDEAKNADRRLNSFERVGDLLFYLRRFRDLRQGEIYKDLKKANLLTFEDIIDDFEKSFGAWAGSRTTINDFVVGHRYDISAIHIFVGSYDLRAGGMFVVGVRPEYQYAVLKATFSGGKYANKWIEPNQRLKYFLKSRKSKEEVPPTFGEKYKENDAILNTPQLPILVFTREKEGQRFTYGGIFRFEKMHKEADQSKWFELYKVPFSASDELVDASAAEEEQGRRVQVSIARTDAERLERLQAADKKPAKYVVVSTAYYRNEDVIAAVLKRASGVCEGCKKQAPFFKKSDGMPYLEVHHRKRLADDGEDTVENAIALCPNCHRQSHYGV